MKIYVKLSLETHLFFGRIMKEHALFLQASFPSCETKYIERADWFRAEFEKCLKETVNLSNGIVGEEVLNSGEIVTEFTERAEKETSRLTCIDIDTDITEAEKKLRSGRNIQVSRAALQRVRELNRQIFQLLNSFIDFKEKILREVLDCRLYTTNYPLLIEHITREAKLYRSILMELKQKGRISEDDLKSMEMFWNQIMMEHALFIRGLLDPSEEELIEAADGFADDYRRLLEEAKEQDCRTLDEMTRDALKKTEQYRDFKAAGAEGITQCKIRSVILPLLADHVLREANHYLRILEMGDKDGEHNGTM